MKKLKPPNSKIFNKWIADIICDYTNRYEVYYGGGGSGKSYGAIQKIVVKCLRDRRKILVIRKVDNTLRHSIYALFKYILGQTGITFIENRSDMTIMIQNGSEIIFKGLQDPERIKSISGITDIMIEEATELTLEDFTQLDIRLRPNQDVECPQIYLMFNPVSKVNWCYKHFFERGTPNRTKIIHTTYKDNKFLTQEYIKTLEGLIDTNPTYYKIYCLGDFTTLDKLVFPKIFKRIINKDDVAGFVFWVGMDFGYTNDPTAITWGYYDNKEKELYITGEYTKKGMTNDVIAQNLKDLGLQKEIVIADGAEPKSIAEIKKAGIPRIKGAVKGKDSVMNGIDKLRRCKIIIDERCVNTIEEFENYTWVKDKKTGEYINQPVDSFNHHIDSIRYGTQNVIGKKTGWKV